MGVLLAGITVALAGPASAATAPTFDKAPIANGFNTSDPVVFTGTATPGATVQLYEDAYQWASGYSKAELSRTPAKDYSNNEGPVTATADGNGRWTIRRPMDSGHILMVGIGTDYSNRRYAAVRVQQVFTATAAGGGTVNFSVGVNPGQPGLPVAIQRYTAGGWSQIASGFTSATGADGGVTGYSATVGGQPTGTPTYRALVGNATSGIADSDNLLISSYSVNLQVAVTGGSDGATPAPSGANPVFTPAITDPDPDPTTTPVSPSPSRSTPVSPSPSRSVPASPSPSKPSTSPTPKPTTPKPTTPPAPAVGSVQFTRIQYNAPGVDRKTNKSINGEYFRLTNKTKKSLDLKGWTVRDAAGNLYRFTTSYTLKAGKNVIVRTGKGTNTTATRYWGKKHHVWNNGGDSALLRTNANKTIDTCKWTKPGKGYTNC
ncbi:lamin tail domain-containing protein [Actinoplanes sp. G11-F43]|uniref:lamin tail domain-containing protein n=1 Tax=Actinoplanes sp. G11-F43 TaxID=3424130 RepID=UPI003D32952D